MFNLNTLSSSTHRTSGRGRGTCGNDCIIAAQRQKSATTTTTTHKKHIKQSLGCCTSKSRTAQSQGCVESRGGGLRHPSNKSIFRVKFHFLHPKNLALFTHSVPLLPDERRNFVNGLSPCTRPRIRYSIKNLGHPVMTSGFLFPVKKTAAPSFT